MALAARNRVEALNILSVDYEECSISYYAPGIRNSIGEIGRNITVRATNVVCAIDPLVKVPTYIRQSGIREILRQGIIDSSTFIMIVAAGQTVQSGDVITDYDGTTYDVLHYVQWRTHAECFLRKIN